MQIEQVDKKTWVSGYIRFVDMGRIENGVTHRYEVQTDGGSVLGTVVWYSAWRRYTFSPSPTLTTYFDFSCLTDIAEFVKMVTDERKTHWGAQGREPHSLVHRVEIFHEVPKT